MSDQSPAPGQASSVTYVHCITITCASCKQSASIYEDMGTAHYESIEHARRELVTDLIDEPEYQWSIEGDDWLCPECTAVKVCEAAGGHDWGDWDVYGNSALRSCRRGHCQQSERRPVETVVTPKEPSDD